MPCTVRNIRIPRDRVPTSVTGAEFSDVLPPPVVLENKLKPMLHVFVQLVFFHTNIIAVSLIFLPSFLCRPTSGEVAVEGRFVACSSRAWRRLTWPRPTTLPLSSCHQGNVSIPTNVPWHPWPSSPICDAISFPHFSSLFLDWVSHCSHYRCVFWDQAPSLVSYQFVMPCVFLGGARSEQGGSLKLFTLLPTSFPRVMTADSFSNISPQAWLHNISFISCRGKEE